MPRLKSPRKLKELCIGNIVKNMDKVWSADYRENYVEKNRGRFSFIEGPFNALDSKCIKEIIQHFAENEKMTKMYLHLLIVPNLKEIDFSDLPKLINNEIIDLVCARCRDVTTIDLTDCNRVSSQSLRKIIESFHKSLIKVSFCNNKLTDDVLEFIGRTCQKLRVLCVDGCKVTRHGLEKLLFTGSDWSLTIAGKNLQALRMMGCSFDNDSDFIIDVLLHCPSMRCITHFCLWEGIAKMCEQNPNPPALNFTGVRYDMPLDMWALQDYVSSFPLIPKCIPYLQHLSVHSSEGMEMSLFHLLTGCGKTLQSLQLDWFLPYEFLNFIGMLCPKLDTFSIIITDVPNDPSQCNDIRLVFEDFISSHNMEAANKPWGKLGQLTISYPTNPNMVVSSSSVLLNIFKNAAATLSFIDFQFMPDTDVNDLLCKALHSKYFENLETLRMNESQRLTSQTICELIETAPKLRYVGFVGCREIGFSEFYGIVDFVQENNYDIEIDEDYY